MKAQSEFAIGDIVDWQSENFGKVLGIKPPKGPYCIVEIWSPPESNQNDQDISCRLKTLAGQKVIRDSQVDAAVIPLRLLKHSQTAK